VKYFGAALYHAQKGELDYAVFYAKQSSHSEAGELVRICEKHLEACRKLNIKACRHGRKKRYKRAAKEFARALSINTQDETARNGLLATVEKGFKS
jgi:hypothetical protein